MLQRLSDNGLTLNGSKCEFRKDRVVFFGVTFGGDGISPDPEKVRAVNEFETVKCQGTEKFSRNDQLLLTIYRRLRENVRTAT